MALVTEHRDVNLRPGEYAVAGADCVLRTLLGSCVSITLWHPKLRVGAMSHFLLARRGPRTSGPLDARYGEESLELMLDALAKEHVFPAQCEAKIFGGGNMFPDQNPGGTIHVGRDNGEAARRLLQDQGIHGRLGKPVRRGPPPDRVRRRDGPRLGSPDAPHLRLHAADWRQFMNTPVRVMVIDDSAVVRQVLTGLLSQAPGHRGDGRGGRPRARHRTPETRLARRDRARRGDAAHGRHHLPAHDDAAERPTPVVICSTLTEQGRQDHARGAWPPARWPSSPSPRWASKQFLTRGRRRTRPDGEGRRQGQRAPARRGPPAPR